MRLAIFGATGTVGSQLFDHASAAGHDLTLLVRRPERLTSPAPKARVVQGDATDLGAVTDTVADCDAVLSALGGSSRNNPAVLRTGTANILRAMSGRGISRLVAVQGFHLPFPGDAENVGQKLIRPIVRMANRHLFEDSMGLPGRLADSTLAWTLVRAPRIRPGPGRGSYTVGRLRLGPWNAVAAGDVAAFMLDCLDDPTSVGCAPMIR